MLLPRKPATVKTSMLIKKAPRQLLRGFSQDENSEESVAEALSLFEEIAADQNLLVLRECRDVERRVAARLEQTTATQ